MTPDDVAYNVVAIPRFTPSELEVLLCGVREVDPELLRKVTVYDGDCAFVPRLIHSLSLFA